MPRPTNKVTVLFLAGYGRSGTTLLDRAFGQIEGFHSAGELRHVWERGFREDQLCGCGERFSACSFWRAVADDAFGGFDESDTRQILALKDAVDRVRWIPRLARVAPCPPEYRSHLAQYTGILEALYASITRVSGARIIVDSSKDPSHGFLLALSPSIDLRVLHVVRDSRAVAHSWMRKRVRPEITDRTTYMPRFTPSRSASVWVARNLLAEGLAPRARRFARLRYESFTTDPAGALHACANALDLGQIDLSFVDGATLHLATDHTAAGNPLRFQVGPVSVRVDDAWRREMQTGTRMLVAGLTWPLLWRYGYLSAA